MRVRSESALIRLQNDYDKPRDFTNQTEVDSFFELPEQIRAVVLARSLTCTNARYLFGKTGNKQLSSEKIRKMFTFPEELVKDFSLSFKTFRYLDFSYLSNKGKDYTLTDAVITHLQDKTNELKGDDKEMFERIALKLLASWAAFEDRKFKTRKKIAHFFLREEPRNFCIENLTRMCASRHNFSHWPTKVKESMGSAKKAIENKWV